MISGRIRFIVELKFVDDPQRQKNQNEKAAVSHWYVRVLKQWMMIMNTLDDLKHSFNITLLVLLDHIK